MSSPYHIHTVAPESSASWKREGSDEPGHEYLIDLSFDDNPDMADRFPSLEEFGAGKSSPSHLRIETPRPSPILPQNQKHVPKTQIQLTHTPFLIRPNRS